MRTLASFIKMYGPVEGPALLKDLQRASQAASVLERRRKRLGLKPKH